MARGLKDSVSSATQKSELIRDATRNFLISASSLLRPNNGVANGMNRYYQIKINSLIDQDNDDINYMMKLSENGTICTKCGNTKVLKLKKRRRENKSSDRKTCRYLRSLCIENCDICNYSKTNKLYGIKSIKQRRQLDKEAPNKDTPSVPNPSRPAVQNFKPKPPKKSKKQVARKVIPLKFQSNPPSFSSRLRAFSCLLKK